jgi:hypothetical protein
MNFQDAEAKSLFFAAFFVPCFQNRGENKMPGFFQQGMRAPIKAING